MKSSQIFEIKIFLVVPKFYPMVTCLLIVSYHQDEDNNLYISLHFGHCWKQWYYETRSFWKLWNVFYCKNFYVKSILGNLKVENLPFWHIFKSRSFEFWFLWIFTLWKAQVTKSTEFRALKMAKTAVLELLDSPKFISRKIRVTKKS